MVETQSGADRFTHLRPDSQTTSFENLSPKIGLVWNVADGRSIYGSYRHSFRAPSIGRLYRSGSSTNTDELDPIKTDSFEIGTRGQLYGASYDLALYHMIIKDDIVSFIDQVSSDRKVTNAGETRHQGIELSFKKRFHPEWVGHLSASYSRQTYEDFVALVGFPSTSINYAGNDVPRAPKTLASASLRHEPLAWFGSYVELEFNHLGRYFTDETNTQSYGGHTISNLVVGVPVSRGLEMYGRITNLTDRVYSTYTSNQVGDPDVSYRPGSPRALFVGLRYEF